MSAGASCTLNGTRIDGNIKVGANATLHAIAVVVSGNIQAEGAADVTVNNNSTVSGSIQIKQGGSATVDGVQVTGDIQLESNASALSATGNRVGGNIQVFQNRGAPPSRTIGSTAIYNVKRTILRRPAVATKRLVSKISAPVLPVNPPRQHHQQHQGQRAFFARAALGLRAIQILSCLFSNSHFKIR